MTTPFERLMAQYSDDVDRIQREYGFSEGWANNMRSYLKRFFAWMEGRPDWWTLGKYDWFGQEGNDDTR